LKITDLDALSAAGLEPNKYKVLKNLVSSQVYRNFADVADYDPAIGTLEEPVADPRWAVRGNCPPKRLWRPVE